ncbi:glutaminyl-peptide cyclotransferase [Novosphingobium sp. 1949]|uniref:Glutaminyl-peptide cyclotransferase n=1 Tax=Novosphingobium organovorum TaxID=2930092 RepID=A0ABT0B9I4_9SPHN|nr:glutaminyl-peptide cyclotransferase [Novosphingobium organovorum]MCJ2181530.1 glutaminyl-peptide cyclotransferase [Novosphingobium organovorum]
MTLASSTPLARALLGLLLTGLCACTAKATPVCSYSVLATYPHDPQAFTEGLFFADGVLYESTGQKGQSRVYTRTLESTTPIREGQVDPTFFGEGSVAWGDQIISLTWRDGLGYRWDRKTLKPITLFPFSGEGWGMTIHDGTIYQSDGSANLILRDPATFKRTGTIAVTDAGEPVPMLNELEWIDGEIWANVWMTDRIARIDPASGAVKSWVDLSGLAAKSGARTSDDVLNGIAYDAARKRIFVTGKDWDKLYQITPKCS